jgi:hypothetical protein
MNNFTVLQEVFATEKEKISVVIKELTTRKKEIKKLKFYQLTHQTLTEGKNLERHIRVLEDFLMSMNGYLEAIDEYFRTSNDSQASLNSEIEYHKAKALRRSQFVLKLNERNNVKK